MTANDNADTIRRFMETRSIYGNHEPSVGEAIAALDALLAERQQLQGQLRELASDERHLSARLIEERDQARTERQQAQGERDAALAKLTPSAVRVYAEVEQLKAERQQAIEALRRISEQSYSHSRKPGMYPHQIARAVLAKLGEKP